MFSLPSLDSVTRLWQPLLPIQPPSLPALEPAKKWMEDTFVRAGEEAQRLGRTAWATAEDVDHEVTDRAKHALFGPPAGPFPEFEDLQHKFPNAGLPHTMVGTTVDLWLLREPGVTPDLLMEKIAAMGMNTVRLGAYWSDIQPHGPGDANFALLDATMAAAGRHGLRVVLSVGVKAPSWPEYYVPDWAVPPGGFQPGEDASQHPQFRQAAEQYVQKVADRYRDHPALAMWQVENEPFDLAGPQHLMLGADMVRAEAELLRQADGGQRPVLINTWSAGDRRDEVDLAFAIADVVGLDVYTRAPGSFGAYERTTGLPAYALEKAKATGKPVTIAELQADDWGEFDATADNVADLTHHLQAMGFEDVLFWRMSQNLKDEKAGDRSLTDMQTQLAQELRPAAGFS